MKNNEIFERELDGNVLRFQVIIPTTRQLTVQVMDVKPQYRRSGNLSEVAFPDDAVAVMNAMAGGTVSGNPDVNGDGSVDIADAVKVLNIMAGH